MAHTERCMREIAGSRLQLWVSFAASIGARRPRAQGTHFFVYFSCTSLPILLSFAASHVLPHIKHPSDSVLALSELDGACKLPTPYRVNEWVDGPCSFCSCSEFLLVFISHGYFMRDADKNRTSCLNPQFFLQWQNLFQKCISRLRL